MKITNFKRIFFDFDGTIVDTNEFKDKAIKSSIYKFCTQKRVASEAYHYFANNKGLPRKQKLGIFMDEKQVALVQTDYSDRCLKYFSSLGIEKNIAAGIRMLYAKNIELLVLSGGSQIEINACLNFNEISGCFNAILADEESKDHHLSCTANLEDSLLIGDSIYDYKCAKKYSLSFMRLIPHEETKQNPENEIIHEHIVLTPQDFYQLCSYES